MTDQKMANERPSLRILHLGFEDPQMPGAGGGSVRTHEMNRRMAESGHRITVLTTRYPGWKVRVQDGVRYVPIGFGQGKSRLTRLAGYVLRLPLEARSLRAEMDLVVEDFFAPFSTMAAPLWTQRPTVGVVQWLHAREKSRQYKVPFHLIERSGVRQHRRVVAVSQGTAEQLRNINPNLHIDVIGNGVDPRALEVPLQAGHDILCIGRLEMAGKGIDLLLKAWADASPRIEGNLVIAGTGPDEDLIRQAIDAAGLADRVRLVGWVSGLEKYELLSSAQLVIVPSRAETFGLVALEALACGTPVIAFDIPCLREVVPGDCGWLVSPFDTSLLADEIVKRCGAWRELAEAGAAGRKFASSFNWDALAARQLEAYYAALQPTAPVRQLRA